MKSEKEILDKISNELERDLCDWNKPSVLAVFETKDNIRKIMEIVKEPVLHLSKENEWLRKTSREHRKLRERNEELGNIISNLQNKVTEQAAKGAFYYADEVNKLQQLNSQLKEENKALHQDYDLILKEYQKLKKERDDQEKLKRKYSDKLGDKNQEVWKLETAMLGEEEIEKIISKFFVFEKKLDWFRKERLGRKVLLNEDDSKLLAKAIAEEFMRGLE